MSAVTVVGGGLAGCEAALALAGRGRAVKLIEMRPARKTPAHRTAGLGELVCTNSFKSEHPTTAHGQLKREMRQLGSALLAAAEESRVPAGAALAVDRNLFSLSLTRRVESHSGIAVVRGEARSIPEGPAVVASGPLTSDALAGDIAAELGDGGLAFYDAIAPIVHSESLDQEVIFAAGRYRQEPDYLNCPLTKTEYDAFIGALRRADVYDGHDWERIPYFEGCLPIEVMAARGHDTLRYGPMKPVGLRDPRTGRRPHAVVQLRREDRAGQMWNLVGFQTRLRTGEQRRVFTMIPGLGERRVPALGVHPPQHLPRLSRASHRIRVVAPPRRPCLRRAADGRGGVHRVRRIRHPGRHQPGPRAERAGARGPADRIHAGRALPATCGIRTPATFSP